MNDTIAVFFGGFSIYLYGIIMALGVIVAIIIAYFTMRSQDARLCDDVLLTALAAMPAALILSRASYCIFMKSDIDKGVFSPFDLLSGGYTMYGALLGAALAAFIISRARGISFVRLADALSPALCANIAIGRMASYFSSGDRGFAIEKKSMQFFPFAVQDYSDGTWHLAVFFFEALAAVAAFIIIKAVYRNIYVKHSMRCGSAALSFIFILGLSQSLLESMRSDSLFLPLLAFVRVAQIISALLSLAVFTVFFIRARKNIEARRMSLICCILGILLYAAAFYMEKKLGDNNITINYSIMSACLIAIAILGLFLLYKSRCDEQMRQSSFLRKERQ